MEESLKKFLKKNPAPSDEKFHAWAERKGIETDKAEAGAYRLAGKYVNLLTSGKSKGKSPEGITPEEKRVGVKIEAEHTDDMDLRKKIRNDHNTEHKRYYSHLPAFEKMLEAEKKGEAMNPLMTGFVDELQKEAEEKKEKKLSLAKHLLTGAAIGLPAGVGVSLALRAGMKKVLGPKFIDLMRENKLMHSAARDAAFHGAWTGGSGAMVGGGVYALRRLLQKGSEKPEKK